MDKTMNDVWTGTTRNPLSKRANTPDDALSHEGHSEKPPAIELPEPSTRRWVISRKAQVVKAVEHGVLSEAEACQRYSLTVEELNHWRELVARHGVRGLRVTRLGYYRQSGAES